MLKGYKWGVAILVGVFGLAYLASEYGWGLADDSQAQAQGQSFTSTGSRSIGRASVRSFGSGSRWSSGGYHSGK